jgi:anti-sigma factor RsiW
MNDCHVEAVEALFRGELDQAEAARVSAHLAACPECKAELRWLERERRFFQSRREAYPPPPSLADVLAATRTASQPRQIAQSRSAAPGRARRVVLGFGLAAAFLIGVVTLLAPPSPSPEVAADPRTPNADELRTVHYDECYACSPATEHSPSQPEPGPESEPCDELSTSSGVTFPVCRPREK